MRASGIGRTHEERLVNALRQCLTALGAESGGIAGQAVVTDHPAGPIQQYLPVNSRLFNSDVR
jgi:hypothetical protein